MLRFNLLVLVACGATSPQADSYDDDDDDQFYRCDAFMRDVEMQIDPEPVPVCGDGRATKQRTSCTQSCSRGCGTEGQCLEPECEYVEERCDGNDIALSHRGETWDCTDNGYVGGELGCSPECELDWSSCVVCIEREGLRCASAELDAGMAQPMLLPLGQRVAVILRQPTRGDIVGGSVDAQLRFRAWPRPLAPSTQAASLIEGKVAFVAEDGSLKRVDVQTRRTESLADAPAPDLGGVVMLLPEHEGSGIAFVWEWMSNDELGFAAFERDGSPARFEQPRYFQRDDQRLIIGQLREARSINGIELESGALVAAAARTGSMGVFSHHQGAFQFHGGTDHADLGHASFRVQWHDEAAYDRIQIQGDDLAQQFHRERDNGPRVEGLGALATAGGRWIDAFGGVLIANAVHTPGTLGLYLVTGTANP